MINRGTVRDASNDHGGAGAAQTHQASKPRRAPGTVPAATNDGEMQVKSGLARSSAAAIFVALITGLGAPQAIASTNGDSPSAEETLAGTEAGQHDLEEDLPIPGEPEETTLPDVDLKGKEPEFSTQGLQCRPGWEFTITKNKKNTMSVKYHTAVKNTKSYPINFKFTSKKSGTTQIGASLTVSGELKAGIFAAIKTEINASVSKSWTSELGIEASGKVKARSTVKGDYGIFKENVYGYKYYRGSACQKSSKKYMKAWAPYREGWVIK
ncbi:hypothetical protein U9R90_28890 [Streptomyces sp. E11-3]|uniref:hypothetical protein n=1 Tax=Streptomyces sp. E11-3 TaxID=3110112 RepID=UPI003980A2DF